MKIFLLSNKDHSDDLGEWMGVILDDAQGKNGMEIKTSVFT